MTRIQPDQGQFVELFWRHGAAVHAYLSRRASRQDADDLLGEVWLQAFRSRERYDRRWTSALLIVAGSAWFLIRPWMQGQAAGDDEAFDELAKDRAHTSWSELVKPALAR